MKISFASVLLLGCTALTLSAEAGDTAVRVGTPTPLNMTAKTTVSLRRPQPLSEPRYDTNVRPASYAPHAYRSAEPTVRAKIDIPRALPASALGLLPLMQNELPEAGPPQGEVIPQMPKKLGNLAPSTSEPEPLPFPGSTSSPGGYRPLPGNAVMPYADSNYAKQPDPAVQPEGNQPPIEVEGTLSGDAAILGECDCGVAGNVCELCCDSPTHCRCWGHKWRPHFWGHGPCCNQDCCNVDCCNNCCNGCGCCDCYPRGRGWISAEYLHMHFSRQDVPPLLTTRVGSVATDDDGELGNPNTRILYGPDQLNGNNFHSGIRLAGGYWFARNPCWGIDGSVFTFGRDNNSFFRSSNGNPFLARPFFDATMGGEPDANIVASTADEISGEISIRYDIRFWGFDVNLRRKLCCGCRHHWDLMLGYRQFQLDEGLEIDDLETFAVLGVPVVDINAFDRFRTRNVFHGGQIGLDGEYTLNARWSLGGTFKLAFGPMRQTLLINGTTERLPVGMAGTTLPQGFLARSSNIGVFTRNRFAFAPEVQLKLQYRLNEKWRAFVAYDVMLISSVVRPGEQIDLTLDPNLMNTTGRPAVLFRTSPFVAQGVNVGVLCNY